MMEQTDFPDNSDRCGPKDDANGNDGFASRQRRARRAAPGSDRQRSNAESASLDRILDALESDMINRLNETSANGRIGGHSETPSDELAARVMKQLGYERASPRRALLERVGRWGRRSMSVLVFCGLLGIGCWWIDAQQRTMARASGIGAIDDVFRASLERNRDAVGEVVEGVAPIVRLTPIGRIGRPETDQSAPNGKTDGNPNGGFDRSNSNGTTLPDAGLNGPIKRREAKAPFRSA